MSILATLCADFPLRTPTQPPPDRREYAPFACEGLA